MAAHSSVLAWEIPWTEEPGGVQSMGHKRVGSDLANTPPPLWWVVAVLNCGFVCISLMTNETEMHMFICHLSILFFDMVCSGHLPIFPMGCISFFLFVYFFSLFFFSLFFFISWRLITL